LQLLPDCQNLTREMTKVKMMITAMATNTICEKLIRFRFGFFLLMLKPPQGVILPRRLGLADERAAPILDTSWSR
jgi:hypothetical protein